MFEKKRILLTSPSGLNNGGVQHVLMTIVRNLSDFFVFDILTFNSIHTYYNKEFESYGGKIYCFNERYETGLKFKFLVMLKLKRFLDELFDSKNYYAVHCNSQFFNSIILKAAKKHNIDIRISHSHGTYKKENTIKEIYRNHCRKIILRCATSIVGCSEMSCKSFYGVESGFFILNNPYDSNNIVQTIKTPSYLCLLQIGLFCNLKNQSFSLDVIEKLKHKFPDVLLRLVGNGDKTLLDNKIRSLGLEKNVVFEKQDEDKKYLFENSSYLIMPSLSEGFPVVLIEAQAGGLYCFASDYITDKTNLGGVRFLPLSDGPQKWADSIADFFLKNKGTKSSFDCCDYTIDHFINDIKNLYSPHDKNAPFLGD